MKTLRIGLAGAGMVSAYHLRAWHELSDRAPGSLELVALADPDLERARSAAAAHGIAHVHAGLDAMLEAHALDAVDLMTPPECHVEHCLAAAQRGVAILCQKPLAPRLAPAQALAETLGNRVRLMVHENWRFRPHYRKIRAWIDQQRIGRIAGGTLIVRSSGLLPNADGLCPALLRQPQLAAMPRLIIAELLVHHLDLALWLCATDAVALATTTRRSPHVIGESGASMQLRLPGGGYFLIRGDMADRASPPHLREELVLHGSHGMITLQQDGIELIDSTSPSGRERVSVDFDADYLASYRDTIAHFVDALRSGTPFETPIHWHLRVLAMVERAYELAAAAPAAR